MPYNKTFTVKVTTPSSKYPSDGWRVYTPGTSDIGPGTGKKVLRQTRAQTQIAGERFGPRPVAKGRPLYVAAVLDHYTPTEGFVPYAGRKVRYYFRPDGSTVWKQTGTSPAPAWRDASQSPAEPPRSVRVGAVEVRDPWAPPPTVAKAPPLRRAPLRPRRRSGGGFRCARITRTCW
ncbi:hypothetical protein ACFVX6_40235 [Streptomyces sp. NPDC058289]|uniref:hypothetical protein n=1 Tax=Streptomyces sp. NPDC058289 TaxID=3346425 RepID=UPI0036E49B00